MHDILTRVWENLAGRVTGPMAFRLILQPTIAAILAIRAGRRDAREGRPPYLWSVFSNPALRRDLLRQGWKDVGKVFALASLLDAVYQIIELRWIYPGEIVLVAAILAIVPYALLRGVVTRITMDRVRGPGTTTPSRRD